VDLLAGDGRQASRFATVTPARELRPMPAPAPPARAATLSGDVAAGTVSFAGLPLDAGLLRIDLRLRSATALGGRRLSVAPVVPGPLAVASWELQVWTGDTGEDTPPLARLAGEG